MRRPGVVLISTYELGRQPFGLAAPAALLRAAGADVAVQDLSVAPLDEDSVRGARLVAFYVPMHTATRLAQPVIARVRQLNPVAHLCAYGLYAPLNEDHFRQLGVQTVLGGEYDASLVALFRHVVDGSLPADGRQLLPVVVLDAQPFVPPDRTGLPPLEQYAKLILPSGQRRVVGSTEASRGCRHLCRHCPIVPVYGGRFRVVPRDVVIEDVRQQVAAGAEHITFGDPDFFNGPAHALRLVTQLHDEFPELSYDVTIKIEHLRQHHERIADLAGTGCILITSAVESFDDAILTRFDKRHTADDVEVVVDTCRRVGVAFNPTFVAFTPWTTISGYRAFLERIAELDLVPNVAPVQYAIRLLVTARSKLLELPGLAALLQEFDPTALCYPWQHPDPAVDRLWRDVTDIVAKGEAADAGRAETFAAVCAAAGSNTAGVIRHEGDPVTIPHMTEPWYCCAEPTDGQLAHL